MTDYLTENEKELLNKLSKPILSSKLLEKKLVHEWNKKAGTNFKSMAEIHAFTGWDRRFENTDWEDCGPLLRMD